MDSFVHLDVQSAFSFLWGTFVPEDLVRKAVEMGQRAVALTDDGLHGMVRFCRAAHQAGIQPIVGARVRLEDESRIALLVRSRIGYGHLCRLLSLSYREGLLPGPGITLEDLGRRSEGLICLGGGRDSPLESFLTSGQPEAARAWLLRLKQAFPHPDSLFVTLHSQGRPQDIRGARRMHSMARSLGLPVVAANAVAYLDPGDEILHETLVGIQQRHHHRRVAPLPESGQYLASGLEMAGRLPIPEALDNTRRIADMCRSFSLPLGKLHPPWFQPPRRAARKLAGLCLKELARRFQPVPAVYLRRLDRELAGITGKNLADFFLLVREVTAFARRRGIRHSTRGSAAGSLVVFLTVGGVDPLAHDLLFERFINEGRGDMPDVDLDFDSLRRKEVLDHIMDRFPDRTAMVGTIHTFKIRSAVRLSARSLGYSLSEIKRFSECLPWSLRGTDLASALDNLPELRHSALRREKHLVDLATRLARLPFQSSVHLGGVIIAPGHIMDWTPVSQSPQGYPVAHLDKDDVEALGLLKLDILGLRMHTAIRKALTVLENEGRAPDPDRLPLDDAKTYALLRSTDSLGVFQIESPGQRQLLGRLQPKCFSDLIAEISLFRPGPVEGNLVDPFVRRRDGEEAVEYLHPDLASILRETYGLILFQEQVLRIVHTFAGLPYDEADSFRRVMTKDRKARQMAALEKRFVDEAVAQGRTRDLAEEVFRQILVLAAYGFCKAHAASFAHITFQSAYLKAHFPRAFFLGLLNAGQVGSYPASVILNEARRVGIPVFPPHVNTGGIEYEPRDKGIQAPLSVIHGVGPGLAGRIVGHREKSGPYSSREDFRARAAVPSAVVKTMDLAGALDGLEELAGNLFPEAAHG